MVTVTISPKSQWGFNILMFKNILFVYDCV